MNPKKQNQQDKIEVIDKLTVKGAIGGDTAAENKHGNPVWFILDEKKTSISTTTYYGYGDKAAASGNIS